MTTWLNMKSAPRDGRAVVVSVRAHAGDGPYHELPYLLRFIDGRWCYAKNRAPVFPWHEPGRWREDTARLAA